VFRAQSGLESVEMHGNVLHGAGGAAVNVMRDAEADWVAGERVVGGDRNWVTAGSINAPAEWTRTAEGADPGFTDAAGFDLRPTESSPLVGAGPQTTASPSGFPFRNPLHPPGSFPARLIPAPDAALARPTDAAIARAPTSRARPTRRPRPPGWAAAVRAAAGTAGRAAGPAAARAARRRARS